METPPEGKVAEEEGRMAEEEAPPKDGEVTGRFYVQGGTRGSQTTLGIGVMYLHEF